MISGIPRDWRLPALVLAALPLLANAEEGEMELEQRVTTEIVELHRFFEHWYRGHLDDSEFARFEQALAENFTIILPGGTTLDRAAILKAVRDSRGSDGDARIRVRNARVLRHGDDLVVATYEEWQVLAGKPERGRLSTVVFQTDSSVPNGLLWLHVHETWLENPD